MHWGAITVSGDRDDGQSGTVFWFTFPYRPDFTTFLASPVNEPACKMNEIHFKVLSFISTSHSLHSTNPYHCQEKGLQGNEWDN